MSEDILWGAAAIGAAIGKSARAAYRMLEQGKLPAAKSGKLWVASRSRLVHALLDKRSDDPPARDRNPNFGG